MKQKFLPDRCREFVLVNITVKKSLSPQELCWHLVTLSYTVFQIFQEISINVARGLYLTFCRIKLHICPRNQVNSFWVPFLSLIPHFVPTTCTDNNKFVPFIQPLWLLYTFCILLILQIPSRPSNEGTQSLNK